MKGDNDIREKPMPLEGEILSGAEENASTNEAKVRAGFWNKIRKNAGKVPYMDEVVASYYCALDPQTPARVRGILLAALAYFILPLDSIPDFLIGFGFTDDAAVLLAAFNAVRGNIAEQHRIAARKTLAGAGDDAPKGETVDGSAV